MKVRVFSGEDIVRALPMAEAVEMVKDAYAQLSSKEAQSPVRTVLDLKSSGGVALIMPSYLAKTGAVGAKVVTVLSQNPQCGLPTTQALLVLFDAKTGSPTAIFEGTLLTRLRTGAATGAATQIFSRAESKNLALFGAGGQAFHQILGVLAVRKIEQIQIFDILEARVDALIGELTLHFGSQRTKILKARSAAEALEGADVVVTVTNSYTPVFDGSWLAAGTHINALGSFKPEMQEVGEGVIRRARVFVDSRSACMEEAGDIIIPLRKGLITESAILAEIGEVIQGMKPGRRDAREITYFKSVGNAVQDIAIAQAVLGKASEMGVGLEVDL
jgi:ornithine cyclodeaminase